jgi:hypothetical protein
MLHEIRNDVKRRAAFCRPALALQLFACGETVATEEDHER